MKTKTLIATAVILVLALAAPVASVYADHDEPGCHVKEGKGGLFMGKTHAILKHSEELGLSQEQIKAIKDLRIETAKAGIRQDAEIKIAELELKAKMSEYPIDAAAANALADQKYELKKVRARQTVENVVKLEQILTKEQHEKLHTLWKESHKRQGPEKK